MIKENHEGLKRLSAILGENISLDNKVLDSIDSSDWPNSGQIQATLENGVVHFLRQSDDKVEELEREFPEFERLTFYYIIGFSDGTLLRRILKKLPQSCRLLCLEPFPELFKHLCDQEDLSDILNDPRFELLLGRAPELAQIRHAIRLLPEFNRCIELKIPDYWREPNFDVVTYQKSIMELMFEGIKMKGVQKRTADKTMSLFLRNGPKGLKLSDLDHISHSLRGKPYIAVGLGPSLAYQIETIKALQDKAFIGVCDNALRELLDAGVDPDIVFQVEWRVEALSFYEGIKFRKPAVLCFTQAVPPQLLSMWPFGMVAYPSDLVRVPFRELDYGKGWSGIMGTNVGDLAIQFGLTAGCSDVYLVGMDFSCPAGSYHHPNTAAMREQYGETNRFSSPEKWDWRYMYGDLQRVETETWDGEKVYSHASFKQSVVAMSWFQKMKGETQNIYSTSKYGARIEADFVPLENLHKEPKLSKTLNPSSSVYPKQRILELLKLRNQEFQRYYRKLEDVKRNALTFIQAFEEKRDSSSTIKNEYLRVLNDFQSDIDLKWLEELVLLMDMGITSMATKKRMELQDEDDVILEKAKAFLDYIDSMKQYRSTISDYLMSFEKEFSHE